MVSLGDCTVRAKAAPPDRFGVRRQSRSRPALRCRRARPRGIL